MNAELTGQPTATDDVSKWDARRLRAELTAALEDLAREGEAREQTRTDLAQMREARDDAHRDLAALNAEITEASRRIYETGVHLAQVRVALREVLTAFPDRLPGGNVRSHLVDSSHIAGWRKVLDSTEADR